jgi:hypothetical protein
MAEHDLMLSSEEAAEFDTRIPHWFGTADDAVDSSVCSEIRGTRAFSGRDPSAASRHPTTDEMCSAECLA